MTVISQVSKRWGVIGAVAAVVLIVGALWATRAPDRSNGRTLAVPSEPSILHEGEVLEVGDDGVTLVATDTTTRDQRTLARCTDCFFAFRKFSASVDGRWLVYSSILCHISCEGDEPGDAMLVVGADGPPIPISDDLWVWAWSPTTEQLAVVAGSRNGTELILLDPATGERTSILTTERAIQAVAWSPDGSTIAYVANRPHTQSQPSGIYLVRPGEDPERIGGSSVRFTCCALDAMNGYEDLVWSPDGSRLALSTQTDGLTVVRIDGLSERTVFHRHPRSFAWSPDGRRIAFAAGGDVVIVPAGGGPPVLHDSDTLETIDQLEAERWIQARANWFRGFGSSVVWSPDGTVVAFTQGSQWKAVSA